MFSAILFTVLNNDLDDRASVTDLFDIANIGPNARRIVRYSANTLNTPYKEGLTSDIDTGLAIISMSSSGNYGSILCIPEGGTITAPCICKKTQTWGKWNRMLTNSDRQFGNAPLGDCAAGKTTDFQISFPEPFPALPKVIVCLRSSSKTEKYGLLTPFVADITTTGFTFRIANAHTTSLTPGGTWYAML